MVLELARQKLPADDSPWIFRCWDCSSSGSPGRYANQRETRRSLDLDPGTFNADEIAAFNYRTWAVLRTQSRLGLGC